MQRFREVTRDTGQGQFVAARSHLRNFIAALQHLVDHGNIAALQAQPLLDGAGAILEQIEGNHSAKHSAGDTAPDQGF
jgi:hypothetical protein